MPHGDQYMRQTGMLHRKHGSPTWTYNCVTFRVHVESIFNFLSPLTRLRKRLMPIHVKQLHLLDAV